MERLIFDCHAHYYDESFDSDRDEVLNSFLNEGVCGVVNAGADISTSKKCIGISENYSFCFSAVGVHPENAERFDYDFIGELENLVTCKKVVGIGEIGLDYHYSSGNADLQKQVFIKQIKLSKKYDLPVIIHDRQAHGDTMKIIKNYHPKGVIHCFSGDLKIAEEALKLGMFLGIGGILTFKNAGDLPEVVKNIPIESMLLETDAPYLAPVPFRGKRCKSSYIKFVADKIADIKSISPAEVLRITKENSLRFFGLGDVL